MRAGACGEDDLRCRKGPPVNRQLATVIKPRAAFDIADSLVAGQYIGVFRPAQLFDQCLFLRDGGGPVRDAGLPRDPVKAGGDAGLMDAFDRADQRLGGHAAEVDARSANGDQAL